MPLAYILTDKIETTTSILDTDLIPIFTDKQSKPRFVSVTNLNSGGILDDNNAFTGNNTFAGTSGFNGVATFTNPIVYDVNTGITAFAGGGQGSAIALTGEYNNVTTVASAYDSVKLLTAVLGQTQVVKNSGANILSVFPNTADSINALAVNLSVDIPVGGEMTFRAISDTVWETIETLYVSSPTTQTGGVAVKATANASNVDVTLTNASHGQATTVTIPDSGLATSYVVQTTAALTVAEADVLDGVIPGTAAASKALVLDGSLDIAGINTIGVADITDFVKFMGINDVLAFSAGTWTTTRVAQGDYVSRKTAADDTTIIGIDITEVLRTTASKGLKLTSFDVIFRNTTADLDAHTVTLDKMSYTDSAAVTTTNVALTGSLGTGQDADPQIDNITIDTPAFNVTDDSKYVMELTVDAAAGSVYDFIGVMLKFTRNNL